MLLLAFNSFLIGAFMTLIPITKFAKADLSFTLNKKKYDDKFEFYKYSYSFANGLCIMQKCTEEGIVITDSWESAIEFMPCKLENDMIMFINPRIGWVRDDIATEKYINLIAEKELLE